ncbi:MAG: hypothetical protein IJI12_05450 [Atopobiaceae bacterium]|nr:hypothetical protein [Atopobiaceae bacterium]
MSKSRIVLEWFQIAFGLLVFSFGVHLTIFANIGVAPWDCLGMGIAAHTPLNYGLAMTVTSVIILFIDLAMRERIGFGTIIDALLTGNFVQFFNDLNPLAPNQNMLVGVALMLVGFVFMAVGMWIYMRAAQGCGPRDALLVGLGKRFPKVPIGVVQIVLWVAVTAVGWLLGGPVGVGTLLSAFVAGAVTQLVYQALHFEPRDVVHRDVFEVSRALAERS